MHFSFFRVRRLPFNKALRILLVTNALILLAEATLGPIYALFVEKVGGSLLDASLAGSVFALSTGTAMLISGKLSDKIKQREVVLSLGYITIGIGFSLYTQVNSVLTLLLVQILIGLGTAIYAPSFDAVYSKHVDEHKEAYEWGAWESTYYFASAFGAFIGGVVVTLFGFNTLFIIMATLAFASAIYIYFLPRKLL